MSDHPAPSGAAAIARIVTVNALPFTGGAQENLEPHAMLREISQRKWGGGDLGADALNRDGVPPTVRADDLALGGSIGVSKAGGTKGGRIRAILGAVRVTGWRPVRDIHVSCVGKSDPIGQGGVGDGLNPEEHGDIDGDEVGAAVGNVYQTAPIRIPRAVGLGGPLHGIKVISLQGSPAELAGRLQRVQDQFLSGATEVGMRQP